MLGHKQQCFEMNNKKGNQEEETIDCYVQSVVVRISTTASLAAVVSIAAAATTANSNSSSKATNLMKTF
jgi:hypothetical protein